MRELDKPGRAIKVTTSLLASISDCDASDLRRAANLFRGTPRLADALLALADVRTGEIEASSARPTTHNPPPASRPARPSGPTSGLEEMLVGNTLLLPDKASLAKLRLMWAEAPMRAGKDSRRRFVRKLLKDLEQHVPDEKARADVLQRLNDIARSGPAERAIGMRR